MRRLVPQFILEKYRAGNFSGTMKAAGLYADLSGFSRMTNELAVHGQYGAEVIAAVMRSVFGPLVEAVYAQGGFVNGYSGDAFMAIFPEIPEQAPATQRCLAAAAMMQSYITHHCEATTRFGKFPIAIKIGLGFGDVNWQIFRFSKSNKATFCLRGKSINRSVNSEKHARPGDIVLDESIYEHLSSFVNVEPKNEYYRVIHSTLQTPASNTFDHDNFSSDVLQEFYSDAILNLPIVGEFRQVVNLFVDIPIDREDDERLHSFMELVFDLQERYGGFFLRPDLSDKGLGLLMFWGAPIAHETDIDRALSFVLDLMRRSPLPLKAGVSYMVAYAGFMGAALREDYTAYGWGVNLAARFMDMAGENEIWMDEEVARRASRHFDVEYLNDYRLKGFDQKQKVFILQGKRESSEFYYQGELVGRQDELETLRSFVSPIFDGNFAGALVVQGEPGIGKSRLVHALQHSHAFGEASVQWVICQADEILRQPLNPFKDWLHKRFQVSSSNSISQNLSNFAMQMDILAESTSDPALVSELKRTSSFLAALVGLSQPNSLYEQLDARGRYENTLIALSVLLRAESLHKPLILFLDDIQWIDDDTRAFFPYFIRTVFSDPEKKYPIAILATKRPGGEFLYLGNLTELKILNLERMAGDSISQLASNLLGAPISSKLLDLLERRTDGNPFFAEQILRYLAENNLLIKSENGLTEADIRAERSLPPDIGAVLIARLDSLPQGVRDVVQTASVLGREFEVRVLAGMMHADPKLEQKVGFAEQANIWVGMRNLRYEFRHALLRDAAYSMQLLDRQRELHAKALFSMETLAANESKPNYGELAYHAEQANLAEKALSYLILAGKNARDVYQNIQALDYYSRAIAITRMDEKRLRFDLMLARAKLLSMIGDRITQHKELKELEYLADKIKDKPLIAQVGLMFADYAYSVSEFQTAIQYARKATDLAQSSGDEEIALDAYRVSPLSLLRLGKLEEAMQQAKEGLQLASKLGKLLEEGKIWNTMGLIALEQKDSASAQAYFSRALAIARETSNRGLETKSLNNLGNFAGFIQGDFSSAHGYYEQAFVIAQERGERSMQSATLGNLGWIAGMQGDFTSARSYQQQALSLAREVGDLYHQTFTLINLSAVAVVQTEAQAAYEYARQAYDLSREIGEKSGEAWALLYMGHACLLHQDYKDATNAFKESVNIRKVLGQPGLETEPAAGLILVSLAIDDIRTAREETEKILSYLKSGGNLEGTEEPLRIYLACYRTLEAMQDARADTVLRSAVKLLDSQTSMLQDEQARHMYVQNVPLRREIMDLWQSKKVRLN